MPREKGTARCGALHHEWSPAEARRLVGRTADMRNAYKQGAPTPAHRWTVVIAALDPESNTVKLFDSLVLAFGEAAAVYAFNRIATALRWLGITLLDLVMTSFFDDFPTSRPRP